MRPIPYLALFSVVSACTLAMLPTENVKAQYSFELPPLKNGCSLSSSTHPDCYDDQNVVRASGFSHNDGSDRPFLTPQDKIPSILQGPPVRNYLWQRLKDTSYSMHVIDQSKPKTLLEIIDGRQIYSDEDYNHWTEIGGKWYVKMAHQFIDNGANSEKDTWCKDFPPSCNGQAKYKNIENVGIGGSTIFFAPILAETAPQATKDKVNLRDWLLARPNEYDLTKPETVNARANFFVGGRGTGFPYNAKPEDRSDKAFWNHVALVWVDPDQLFRPAQNWNIKDPNFATVNNHLDDPTGKKPTINWCINQFKNVMEPTKNNACDMADTKDPDPTKKNGNIFDNFRDFYLSYFNAGSNNDDTDNFFPFPFTGLGVTYDPYYQAQLEAASTEDELALILPKLIGTSEFIYAIPKDGSSDDAKMYLDEVYPIINTVPGPLPILGVGASFAFTRRLRRRIRQGGRVSPQR